jgi:hypothetical protein
MFYTGA